MAVFVLVHGGGQGGWVWRPTARLLRQDGHEVFTPSQADFDKAVQILAAYRHATEVEGRGAVMLGDEMIDEASRKMAVQLETRGRAAGLTPSPRDATAEAAAGA